MAISADSKNFNRHRESWYAMDQNPGESCKYAEILV